jgi:uncharacterized protein with PQ loop repeat
MLNETLKDLLLDLGLEENYTNPSLDMLLAGDSKYLRDLRMNLKGFWKSKDLSEKEAHLISVAIANNNDPLKMPEKRKVKPTSGAYSKKSIEYTNPENGLVDVIMTGTSDNDYVGYLGSFFISINLIPQIYHIYKIKNVKSISIISYFLNIFSAILMIAYGILINKFPIIISNSMILIFSVIIG